MRRLWLDAADERHERDDDYSWYRSRKRRPPARTQHEPLYSPEPDGRAAQLADVLDEEVGQRIEAARERDRRGTRP